MILLEVPSRDEIVFELKPQAGRAFLPDKEDCEKEIETRKRDYPELEQRFIKTGVPAVGQTGLALQYWIWPKAGIRRDETFIDHTIRCLPPRSKSGVAYPTGDTRKAAELHCRRYDRLEAFRPDTVVFSLHPSGFVREITPLPLTIKDFEKVRDFTSQGRRVLALLGGKATQAFVRYGSNCTRWRGHFSKLATDWVSTYRVQFQYRKTERKRKVKNVVDDFFGIPELVQAKVRQRHERPKETILGSCKGAKRHTYRSRPKCGYTDCWNEFQRRQDDANLQSK